MQDGIIKGTGNSRYLKSISNFLTQYPTYQDFVAALVAGTLPIDLNGINETGWDQLGTALNKANLLSDETAEALGLTSEAVPDDAFASIPQNYLKCKVLNTSQITQPNSGVMIDTADLVAGRKYAIRVSTEAIPKVQWDLSYGFASLVSPTSVSYYTATSYRWEKIIGSISSKNNAQTDTLSNFSRLQGSAIFLFSFGAERYNPNVIVNQPQYISGLIKQGSVSDGTPMYLYFSVSSNFSGTADVTLYEVG